MSLASIIKRREIEKPIKRIESKQILIGLEDFPDCIQNKWEDVEILHKKKISLAEFAENGEMPPKKYLYHGSSDYLPLPFEYLRYLGIEFVTREENIGNNKRINYFYKTKEGVFYAIHNLPNVPIGYEDYNDNIVRVIESILKKNPDATPKQINGILAPYQWMRREYLKWLKAYINRETGFIEIKEELHPKDFPHPELANHEDYRNLKPIVKSKDYPK
ncbi:MAG: hypothetical protein KJ674_01375 [Nanoarchaeota archaeon]|nr:hypothetical protein [Nanoarchaeota archaeon]